MMTRSKADTAKWLTTPAGLVLILAAVLIPSGVVAEAVGGRAAPPAALVMGATVFRVSLAALGVAVVVLSRLSLWKRRASVGVPTLYWWQRPANLALAGVLLMGAFLRLYGLNTGLWHDEILTNVLYVRMPVGVILTTFESENQHFLYSLLAHLSVNLLGESAGSLRLPAALFGIGSIWALYVFSRDVLGSRPALLAAALMSVSYTHIWFSQNARGYSGLLFWTLLSSWLLLRSLRDRDPRFWVGYAFSAALGLYTHFTMIFVLIGQFALYVWALLARRKQAWPDRWAGIYLGFGLGALLTLLLYALVLPQLVTGMGQETSVVNEWKNPLWTLVEVLNGLQVSFQGGVVALGALVVAGAGLLGLAKNRRDVIWLTFGPPVVGAAVVVGLGHHLWPRFFFFAMGFGALIVVHGADRLGQALARLVRLSERQAVWAGTGACLALVLVAATSIPTAYLPKQDFQGALEFVEANQGPGDQVVTAGLAAFTFQHFYEKDWAEVTTLAELNGVRSKAERTWLVYSFPTVLRSTAPEVMDSILQDFEVVQVFGSTVGDGAIYVCRAGPAVASSE
jgi:4-amino-4-deoxy-L-arabinose transferase-like glycosyltransferase